MSLLSYYELCVLVEDGVISGVDPNCINGTSIDVHLGEFLLVEDDPIMIRPDVWIAQRQKPIFTQKSMCDEPYWLKPNEFVLGQTQESFDLPLDISGDFCLKSSLARSGLNHSTACWADPGWHGSVLTLELKNVLRYTTLVLEIGMPIGQVKFWRSQRVPVEKSYRQRGRYNNDMIVMSAK